MRTAALRALLDREEVRRLAAEKSGFSPEALSQIAQERARVEGQQRRKRALESWLRTAAREVGTAPLEEIEELAGCGWEGRLQIVSGSEWTVDDIEAYTRAQSKKRPLGGVFVDYLQRVPSPPSGRVERRDQEVSAIGRRFKTLAGDIKAPIIAGAQINREAIPEGYSRQMNSAKTYAEARKLTQNARPESHHLREGGSEQEADLALGLLFYGADYRGEAPAPLATKMEAGTLKNRNGEPGKWATLAFEGRFGRVREADEEEDV